MTKQLQKAYLEVETGGDTIECMFNPATFSFQTRANWTAETLPGRNTPSQRYSGGGGGSFSLNLTFDTTGDGKSVTSYTDKLLKLMEIDTSISGYNEQENNGRPPWVKFHWGTHLHSFRAVITSATVNFTYFSHEGVPLRATVDLSLVQYEADGNWGPQNPTSGTPNPHRSHQVRTGDTLDRIAAKYYGDSTQWRDIARINSIADPLDLAPGQIITVPEHSE